MIFLNVRDEYIWLLGRVMKKQFPNIIKSNQFLNKLGYFACSLESFGGIEKLQ